MAGKLRAFGLFTDENDRVPVSEIRRRVLLSRRILLQGTQRLYKYLPFARKPRSRFFTKPVTCERVDQEDIFDFS